MPLSREERNCIDEADLAGWTQARAQDSAAESTLRKRVATLDTEVGAITGREAPSPFLRRQALLRIARELNVRPALAQFQAAAQLWWAFVPRHERLIQSTARRYARRGVHPADRDDLIRVLEEATMRAAVDWEPARGSYCTVWMQVARTCWQRAPERQSTVRNSVRTWRTTQVVPNEPDEETLVQDLPDDSALEARREFRALTHLEATLVRQIVVEEETLAAVAIAHRMSQGRVSSIVHSALRRMRNNLEESTGKVLHLQEPPERVLFLVAN